MHEMWGFAWLPTKSCGTTPRSVAWQLFLKTQTFASGASFSGVRLKSYGFNAAIAQQQRSNKFYVLVMRI